MSEPPKRSHQARLLTGGAFALPLLCCVGLPLLVGAGLGLGLAFALIAGSLAGGLLAIGLVLSLLAVHRRRALRQRPAHALMTSAADERIQS